MVSVCRSITYKTSVHRKYKEEYEAVSVTVDFGGSATADDYAVNVVTGGTWNSLNGLLTLAVYL